MSCFLARFFEACAYYACLTCDIDTAMNMTEADIDRWYAIMSLYSH